MNLVPPWSGCKGYRVKSLAAAVLLVLAATASHPALMAQTPAPVIEKLKPTSGPVGTNVKIKGEHFGTTRGSVTFNGTSATVESASDWEDEKIQVEVPEGATTGNVVVTTSGGQASAGVTFTVTEAPSGPTIDKLEPDSGPTGTEVKIKGTNFGSSGTVTFNGVTASQINWTDKKIRVNVPSTATTGNVVVTPTGEEASNGVTFTVTAGVPSISKLEPDSGPVLTQVKIKGSNFGDQEGTVTFNGVTNDPSRWNHDIIHAQVPSGAQSGPVVVTTAGGQSSSGVTFTVTNTPPAPSISNLDPSSGLVGASVTIEGSNFGTTSGTVTFNGTTASTTSWASDEIQTKVPSGATTGPVVVRTSGGQSSAGVTFTVTLPAPVISRLDPNSGLVDASVTIEGSNFGSSSGTVTFNGTTASTTSWDADEIQTKVPSGATTGPVVVRTSGGQSSAGVSFTVTLPAPVISRLDPNSGLVDASVTIEGSNFGSQTGSVTFNGTTASTTSWDSDEIQTKVPSGATTGPVVVRTSGGQSSAGVSFTVTLPAPVISRLDPNSGLVDANVTIEGSNFGSSSGTVTFNGTTASTTSWASDEIQTKVPSGATTGPVVVRTSGGQSSAGVTFTVTLPAPVISRLDPNSGLVDASVTIEGSNFGTSSGTVTFNGTTASTTSWASDEIQTKVPSGATTGPVVVRTSGGQSSAGVSFTVTLPAPVISRLDPDSGLVDASVTIEGSNFGTSSGTVTFNGTTASTTSWASDEIQTKVPSGATSGPVVVRTSGGQSSAGVSFTVTLPAPVISRLDPNSGLVDASVTIEGSNFGTTSGTVTFNGTTASTTSWDADEIQTKVPSGATTGPVVVRTSGGQSSAGVSFTVTLPAPVISRLDPNSGLVDANVTIEGSNLGTTSGTVTFNGTTASTTSWDTDEIQTKVPDGATTGPVVVTTAGGQSSAGVTFTVIIPAPVISRLDPDSGPVDAEVRIHGSNFGATTGTVTFNGVTASPNQWNDQTIRVRVPDGATTGPVVVTTAGGQSSAGVTFTVTDPPSGPIISKLEPDSGLVGANVKIEGSNFGTSSGTVTFNGTTAFTTSWDTDEIQTKVPDGATTGLVVVTAGGKASAGVTFTVTLPAPVISRLDPNSGLVDANVTIEGSNFGSQTGSVTFNGTTASTTSWDADEIQTSVPSGATTGPVVVTTAGGKSSAGVTFTVTIPAPVISRLDPNSGLVDANVTIEGSNFGSQTGSVTFNGTTASTTSWDAEEIQTSVPDGATSGPVVVRTSGGQSSAGVSFTVTLPAPVISRLDPNSGLVDANVTIEGSNFGSRTGTVTFNGTTASTTSWDSDEIQTKVPSGATTGPVVVTTAGGQSSAGVSFTVTLPAPVISRLDPDSGPVDAEVRIHGSNFGATTGTVTFNGVTASPNQWNVQTIRVRVPEGATTGPVVVTTSGGQSSAGVAFTVTDPPSGPIISKLEPDSGLVGTKVKITGSNFGTSSGTVTFNGTTASTTSWDSDEIQTKVPDGATTGLVVVTVDGESSAGVSFTVTIPAPVISRLDPDSGLVDTNVTIEGSNFGSQTGTVTFNGTTASTTSWDSDEIQTKVPDGATTGPVVVTTAGGQSSAGVSFTVTIPAPVISRLDPDSGPVDAEVGIHGSNFGATGRAAVTFNGVTASPNQWNVQTIRVRVPDGATTGPVVVTTAGGRSSAGVTFTVTDPEPEPEDPSPEDPSDFSSSDLTGTSFTLNGTRLDGSPERVTVLFREGNRFEAAGSRTGSYDYRPTGPSAGTLALEYDGGGSCEVELAFDSVNSGAFSFECSTGGGGSGRFRLTAGTTFVPVILTAAGRNDSFFTSEMTLTNRGTREARLHYTYTAHIGGGTGSASEVLPAGHQRVVSDALDHLRNLGIPIPAEGNRIGTLRVEAPVASQVGVLVRTTTAVPDGRAGLAYPGIGMEEGFQRAVYLCGLRQNELDRSNVAFQNMGAPEEGPIILRTTVFSGDPNGPAPRVLQEVRLGPGGFHQYSGVLGSLANGYVRVERVEGTAPFYAYGVINDQANSDGSYVFPVVESFPGGAAGQTLPVIVETTAFTSELTVTNFSAAAKVVNFSLVADGIQTTDHTVRVPAPLAAGQQLVIPELVDEVRRRGLAGIGPTRGGLAGPLFATVADGNMEGIVIGARTVTQAVFAGGQYGVFYNAAPYGSAFSQVAWVEGLQQNRESRSNLALVNTGEVDDSQSVFAIDIYDGDRGLLVTTITGRTVPARGWRQINSILRDYAEGTTQGYVRIRKISGNNPFLAYGVINDGGSPGERSGDGAYVPARE